jgi:hypothetical protein
MPDPRNLGDKPWLAKVYFKPLWMAGKEPERAKNKPRPNHQPYQYLRLFSYI